LNVLAVMSLAACGEAVTAPLDTGRHLPGDWRPLHVFVLAGQSNMAGRGQVEAEDRTPIPNVWMLDRSGAWVPAVEPMHADILEAGVGPGRAFAAALAARDTTIAIGLVPAAVGGSGIAAWVPGASYEPLRVHPYDDALARTRLALAHGTLAGILWHQGETDADSLRAPLYVAKLRALVVQFRADLNAPAVPFLVGQLGQFSGRPWTPWDSVVNAAHEALPMELPFVRFVSSAGLTDMGDATHFSSASARALGRRYADALASMQTGATLQGHGSSR
jgi:hypothetical protein